MIPESKVQGPKSKVEEPAPAVPKKTITERVLEVFEKAEEILTPYRHPESGRTVAWHHEGEAFTATGIHAGKAIVDFVEHVIEEPKGRSL